MPAWIIVLWVQKLDPFCRFSSFFYHFWPFLKKFTKANFVLEGWQLLSIFLQVCTILKLLLLSKYHHKWLSNDCTNWTRFVDFYHFYHIWWFLHIVSAVFGRFVKLQFLLKAQDQKDNWAQKFWKLDQNCRFYSAKMFEILPKWHNFGARKLIFWLEP